MDQLAKELRRRREEAGLSLRDVEKQLKISASSLSRLERGQVRDLSIVERVAKWLGVNVRAGKDESDEIETDEDLVNAIAVHLRAKKQLPEEVARAIARTFRVVMDVEIQRRTKGKSHRGRG